MNKQSQYEAGYTAGINADVPLRLFEMSLFCEDYQIGYVVGLAYVQSVRCATPRAGASEAAEMGKKYRIPFASLKSYFNDPSDPDVLEFLRSGYGLDEDDYDEDDQ